MDRGRMYGGVQKRAEAAEAFREAGATAEMIGWDPAAIHGFNRASLAAFRSNDLRSAVRYLRARLRIHEKLKDTSGIAGTLTNLGIAYYRQGDLGRALSIQGRALSMKRFGFIGKIQW